MNWLIILISLVVGFILGLVAAFVLKIIQSKNAKELADELFRENEAKRKENIDVIIENIKASFGSLSLDALSKSTAEFLKLAKTTLETEREAGSKELESKKGLIDQQLQQMTSELEKVNNLVKNFEKDREQKFGELASQLESAGKQTSDLMQITNSLREALASTRIRGQWGERMAEDVLRLAGFIENVNYVKQKTIEGIGSRPDFTFLLPSNLKMNMDVKFPLDNYVKHIEAKGEQEKIKFRNDFLKDVKAKVKEVTTREYINPEQNTVDCVLLFIPNEQIYSFIHEEDSSIIDDAIKNKVIFCSPITLFAVLAIVRQATDNFALEKTSNQILSLLGAFKKQWQEFVKKFELLGKRIEDAHREYESLATTRRRQLERPLDKIEDIRIQQGLPITPIDVEISSSSIENSLKESGHEGEIE